MTWTDFWPLDLTFTNGHGWWLDPLQASVGQGAEYWPPRAIRDLICPLRWLSLVNLTFLCLMCHTELFLLTMNYKTVRIYSHLPSERRRFSFILNLIGTVIIHVRRLLGLLLTKSMNCPSFKATSHPERNTHLQGKGKLISAVKRVRLWTLPWARNIRSYAQTQFRWKIRYDIECRLWSSSWCSFSNRVFIPPFKWLHFSQTPSICVCSLR